MLWDGIYANHTAEHSSKIIKTHLRSIKLISFDTIFMHHPVCSLSFGSTTFVEYESPFHPNLIATWLYRSLLSGCLPVTSSCSPVGFGTLWIFLAERREEEPFMIYCLNNGFVWSKQPVKISVNLRIFKTFPTQSAVVRNYSLCKRFSLSVQIVQMMQQRIVFHTF